MNRGPVLESLHSESHCFKSMFRGPLIFETRISMGLKLMQGRRAQAGESRKTNR